MKLLFPALLLVAPVFAAPSPHFHQMSVEALQLALQLDKFEEEGIVPPAVVQQQVDKVAGEVVQALFAETLPLSTRLTALAALTRLGPGTTAAVFTPADIPKLRNAELQSMARVSLEVIQSRRLARLIRQHR